MAMKVLTSRQRYLYLLARLYELAAEFSEEELSQMQASFSENGEPVFNEVLSVISKIHRVGAPSSETLPRVSSSRLDQESGAQKDSGSTASKVGRARRDRLNPKMLESLFDDRELFPKLNDIASLFPIEMAPQYKEARGRYIRRAVKYILMCSEDEIEKFRTTIAHKLPVHRSQFVSQWKSLIKDL